MNADASASGRTRLLMIDDDRKLCRLVSTYLEPLGFDVTAVHTGPDGVDRATAASAPWHAILLDVMLPGLDGFEVLKRIRAKSAVPVLMLTARGDETDRIVGLELGADDYVVKPFSVRELAARVRAVARRRRIEPNLESGRLVVDRTRHLVTVDDHPVELTAKEFDLLAVLAEEPGRAVTRQELFSRVWDPVWIGTGKTLDVHVASLRKKLGDPELIETVRGVGYRLAVEKA